VKARTSRRPESAGQARQWQMNKTRYQQSALCETCAAQAAWAHQAGAGGWVSIHPPCASCSESVSLLPYPTANPLWRAVIRKRA
jgi:hypothetical protein